MLKGEIKSQIKDVRKQIEDLEMQIKFCRLTIKGIQLRCKHPDKFSSYTQGDYDGLYCPDCEAYL